MQIKNVDNFNLQDCERFLNQNPDSHLADAVRVRQGQLMEEVFLSKKKDEEARKAQISSCRKKMSWIDMALFNEKKRYKTLSTLRCIIFGILIICLFTIGAAIYYSKTEHYIYEQYSDSQAIHVTGIEHILLKIEMIEPLSVFDDVFSPHWGLYYITDVVIAPIIICLVSILSLLLSGLFHSPLIKKIYNIQNGNKSQKYRAIQNKQGKMGLCKVGRLKIKKVLPIDYNDIFMICDNSYICKKDGKYGIYNTEANKMLVPIQYDDIYAITDDSIELIMNSQVHRFTRKGYRIVNQ